MKSNKLSELYQGLYALGVFEEIEKAKKLPKPSQKTVFVGGGGGGGSAPGGGAVDSVNGQTGVVLLDTDDIPEGVTNLYYTDARVSANPDVAANTAARHDALTLGTNTAGALSLVGQVLSINDVFVQTAGDSMTGFLTLHADPTAPLHAATKQYVDGNAVPTFTHRSVIFADSLGALTEQNDAFYYDDTVRTLSVIGNGISGVGSVPGKIEVGFGSSTKTTLETNVTGNYVVTPTGPSMAVNADLYTTTGRTLNALSSTNLKWGRLANDDLFTYISAEWGGPPGAHPIQFRIRDNSSVVNAVANFEVNGDFTMLLGNIVMQPGATVDGVDVSQLSADYTAHAADTTIHFTEASIDHLNIQNIGTNTHVQIDTHIASTSNPHSVVANQVNITDTGGYYTGTEVEAALQEIGASGVLGGSFAENSIIYAGVGGVLSENNADFKWTNSLNRMNINGRIDLTMVAGAGVGMNLNGGTGNILFRATSTNVTTQEVFRFVAKSTADSQFRMTHIVSGGNDWIRNSYEYQGLERIRLDCNPAFVSFNKGTFRMESAAVTDVPLTVQAFAGQTANLQEWTDSTTTAGFVIDSGTDGVFKNYPSGTRPPAGTPGRVIYNITSGNLNIDDGTRWLLPDGTTDTNSLIPSGTKRYGVFTWVLSGNVTTGFFDAFRVIPSACTIVEITMSTGQIGRNGQTVVDIYKHVPGKPITTQRNATPGTSIYASNPGDRPTMNGFTGQQTDNGVVAAPLPIGGARQIAENDFLSVEVISRTLQCQDLTISVVVQYDLNPII